MAVVTIVNENKTLRSTEEIASGLAQATASITNAGRLLIPSPTTLPPGEILAAYSREIEELKTRGGYVTADVIDVNPATPASRTMLAKFNREHWHDEDEVRFIIAGHGMFHIHTQSARCWQSKSKPAI